MLRRSAWIICAILLCFGHASVYGDEVKPMKSGDKETNPPSGNPVSPQQHDSTPPETHNRDEGAITSSSTSNEPSNPTKKSDESSTKAGDPIAKPTDPTTKPTHPTMKPTDPTPKPTDSTPKPTDPITKPNDPTTKPVEPTTKPVEPTTKPVEPTTKPPAPLTTPKPIPQQVGDWKVVDKKTNVTCIRVIGKLSISYQYVQNKTNVSGVFNVPKDAIADGLCESGKIELTWDKTNSLSLLFKKDDTHHNYSLENVSGQLFVVALNETKHFEPNKKVHFFETPLNQSYKCDAMRQIPVDDHAKIVFSDLHFQAYKISKSDGFDTVKDCNGVPPPHTADIVPVVVGCILALLVIAVLVAYLISRRRSQTRGYLSM